MIQIYQGGTHYAGIKAAVDRPGYLFPATKDLSYIAGPCAVSKQKLRQSEGLRGMPDATPLKKAMCNANGMQQARENIDVSYKGSRHLQVSFNGNFKSHLPCSPASGLLAAAAQSR